MSAVFADSIDLKPFHDWRASLSATELNEQRFDEWVFLNASSVLLSEKTGELLALDMIELNLKTPDVEVCVC